MSAVSVSLPRSGIIPATDITDGGLDGGLYRVSYYARITSPRHGHSSLQVSFDWIDGGVVQTFGGGAIMGNLTTNYQSETRLIHVDPLSPVRYSTAYVSIGATSMQYALYFTLEKVQG